MSNDDKLEAEKMTFVDDVNKVTEDLQAMVKNLKAFQYVGAKNYCYLSCGPGYEIKQKCFAALSLLENTTEWLNWQIMKQHNMAPAAELLNSSYLKNCGVSFATLGLIARLCNKVLLALSGIEIHTTDIYEQYIKNMDYDQMIELASTAKADVIGKTADGLKVEKLNSEGEDDGPDQFELNWIEFHMKYFKLCPFIAPVSVCIRVMRLDLKISQICSHFSLITKQSFCGVSSDDSARFEGILTRICTMNEILEKCEEIAIVAQKRQEDGINGVQGLKSDSSGADVDSELETSSGTTRHGTHGEHDCLRDADKLLREATTTNINSGEGGPNGSSNKNNNNNNNNNSNNDTDIWKVIKSAKRLLLDLQGQSIASEANVMSCISPLMASISSKMEFKVVLPADGTFEGSEAFQNSRFSKREEKHIHTFDEEELKEMSGTEWNGYSGMNLEVRKLCMGYVQRDIAM